MTILVQKTEKFKASQKSQTRKSVCFVTEDPFIGSSEHKGYET